MTDIFQYLRNWFDRKQPKYYGKFKIENGALVGDYKIATGQFFRIIGSASNDGVYIYGQEKLQDEEFEGAIWLMAVPQDVRLLIIEIDMWVEKYGADSASPYQSESFGGYSYSKASGTNGGVVTWQDAFSKRLNMYRRIRV
jgi:hypothetical protein